MGIKHTNVTRQAGATLLGFILVSFAAIIIYSVLPRFHSFSDKLTTQAAVGTVTTDANLKVAFIGDQGLGTDAEAVLQLIKSEGAQAVIHTGDFEYKNDPAQFDGQIQKILQTTIPYFGNVGNHDTANWTSPNGGYQAVLNKRSGTYCVGDKGNMAACTYKGLFFLELGIGSNSNKDDPAFVNYIKAQLAQSNAIWKICNWHENQAAMQVGGKSDSVGWQAYEACREAGAIVSTSHEHTYHRTKTLVSMTNQTVDPSCNTPNQLCLAPGKTFAFVSGLGGSSIRTQQRCLPTTYPYGCNGEWAKIYTSDQGADYGALFIVFNYQGNPLKAHGYFKNIANQIVDEFDITAAGSGTTTPPTSGSCPRKSQGDADCDSLIKLSDFEIFRKEYTNVLATKTADFNIDSKVDLADFQIFRNGYFTQI